MSLWIHILKGDVDEATGRKWALRITSLLLLLVMAFPLAVFARVFDGSLGQIIFIGAYLIVFVALLALVIGLWRSTYAALLARWQRTPILLVSLIAPWLWLAVYELALIRRPIDLMFVFNYAALLWTLLVAIVVPNLNLAKAASFLVIFLICLALITPGFVLYSHTMYSRWLQFDTLPDDSLDVIYVGNSHALYAFQPRVIDNLLGIRSYTIGTTATDTKTIYYQLRDALQTQHPDVIVFETLPLSVDNPDLATVEMGYLLPLHGIPALEATFDVFRPVELKYAASPLLYYHTAWQNGPLSIVKRGAVAMAYETLSLLRIDPNAVINQLGLEEGSTADELGAVLAPDTVPPEVYDQPVQYRSISPQNGEYFRRIVAMCRDEGIQLVLLRTPILDQAVVVPPALGDLAEAFGLEFHDFNALAFHRIHFNDKRHVNVLGGMLASVQTAEILSDDLGVPVDETTQAEYAAILVDDLSIALDGDTLTYRLIMADPESPDAEFRWHVTDAAGNVLADLDYGDQPAVSFTMPDEGNYRIAVDIRNRLNPEISASAILTERYDPALAG